MAFDLPLLKLIAQLHSPTSWVVLLTFLTSAANSSFLIGKQQGIPSNRTAIAGLFCPLRLGNILIN